MNKIILLLVLGCGWITHLSAQSQVPNAGFENWATDINGDFNPVGWTTSNSNPDTTVFRYTPAYAGNYSMLVKVYELGFINIPGTAYAEFPYTQRPINLSACINATVTPGDQVFMMFYSHNGDSTIAAQGDCTFKRDSSTNGFVCISLPIVHISSLTPDSATIMVLAGKLGDSLLAPTPTRFDRYASSLGVNGSRDASAKPGTKIIVDEIAFNTTTTIAEPLNVEKAVAGNVYPNPSSASTIIPLTLNRGSEISLLICDALGREVKNLNYGYMNEGSQSLRLDVSDLSAGMYGYSIKGEGFTLSGRLIAGK